jgi:hypothetical protein
MQGALTCKRWIVFNTVARFGSGHVVHLAAETAEPIAVVLSPEPFPLE